MFEVITPLLYWILALEWSVMIVVLFRRWRHQQLRASKALLADLQAGPTPIGRMESKPLAQTL